MRSKASSLRIQKESFLVLANYDKRDIFLKNKEEIKIE